MRKYLFLFISLLLLTSCKAILLNALIKDPKVENTTTIKNFQTENNFSTKNSLILKVEDSAKVLESLMLGLSKGYSVYDKNGKLLCYKGSETCSGVQFRELIGEDFENFSSCNDASQALKEVLTETYDLNENPVDPSKFNDSDYYIVSYWQKFLGGKRGYEDQVKWMEDELENLDSDKKFTFIKINTDFQESWGLEPGNKTKIKIKTKGNQGSMQIINIPYKKHN